MVIVLELGARSGTVVVVVWMLALVVVTVVVKTVTKVIISGSNNINNNKNNSNNNKRKTNKSTVASYLPCPWRTRNSEIPLVEKHAIEIPLKPFPSQTHEISPYIGSPKI